MFESLGLDLKGIGSEGVVIIAIYLIGEKTGLWSLIKRLVTKSKNGNRTQKIEMKRNPLCKDHSDRIGKCEDKVAVIESRHKSEDQ